MHHLAWERAGASRSERARKGGEQEEGEDGFA